MSFDNAYEALTEQNDSRWAFGTGFDDPLSGVDGSVPDGVDGAVLAHYCLALGDDALDFLGTMPVRAARDWLESIGGIGPKTSAAVLAFSRLRLAALPVEFSAGNVAG